MKRLLLPCLLLAAAAACSPADKSAEATDAPERVIFDTDLGNDIDDVLALQMLLGYVRAGKIDLAAVTVSKANAMAPEFARRYIAAYGSEDTEIGYVYTGPNTDDGNYLRAALDVFPADTATIIYPEASALIRQILKESPDSSVTVIATGPFTNLARLVEADSALVAEKVKSLTLMGGDYRPGALAEWNVAQDTTSARILFEKWPGPIVAAGFEVGAAVKYPASAMLADFDATHPLNVAYRSFLSMPYDRPCWDLTAVIAAVEGTAPYFGLSEPGRIAIADGGSSVFTSDSSASHRYLTLASDSLLLARIKEL